MSDQGPIPEPKQPVHIGWKYSSGIGKDKKFVINTNKGLMDFDQYAIERGLTASCLNKRYSKYGGNSEHPGILDAKFCTGNRIQSKPRTKKKVEQPIRPSVPRLEIAALVLQGFIASNEYTEESAISLAWDYAEGLVQEGCKRGLIRVYKEEA